MYRLSSRRWLRPTVDVLLVMTTTQALATLMNRNVLHPLNFRLSEKGNQKTRPSEHWQKHLAKRKTFANVNRCVEGQAVDLPAFSLNSFRHLAAFLLRITQFACEAVSEVPMTNQTDS